MKIQPNKKKTDNQIENLKKNWIKTTLRSLFHYMKDQKQEVNQVFQQISSQLGNKKDYHKNCIFYTINQVLKKKKINKKFLQNLFMGANSKNQHYTSSKNISKKNQKPNKTQNFRKTCGIRILGPDQKKQYFYNISQTFQKSNEDVQKTKENLFQISEYLSGLSTNTNSPKNQDEPIINQTGQQYLQNLQFLNQSQDQNFNTSIKIQKKIKQNQFNYQYVNFSALSAQQQQKQQILQEQQQQQLQKNRQSSVLDNLKIKQENNEIEIENQSQINKNLSNFYLNQRLEFDLKQSINYQGIKQEQNQLIRFTRQNQENYILQTDKLKSKQNDQAYQPLQNKQANQIIICKQEFQQEQDQNSKQFLNKTKQQTYSNKNPINQQIIDNQQQVLNISYISPKYNNDNTLFNDNTNLPSKNYCEFQQNQINSDFNQQLQQNKIINTIKNNKFDQTQINLQISESPKNNDNINNKIIKTFTSKDLERKVFRIFLIRFFKKDYLPYLINESKVKNAIFMIPLKNKFLKTIFNNIRYDKEEQ
ncbi:hypothetical protein PPERSA_02251 [Pseudocohnilembus persalinus]|uniref:Uncharacterized protein n=1 Tax=Pseudocohnilembus persalinus TaxID=266149 RepID=A0A0V0QKC7_PSEPJ|nr:hypothetical protein PPERSA_02251 [Pseudocohnilembus persalinus]|eukprot:KRX02761.1 hypothetical protein PPERSA_02251 [Pseudocohnilembus persalinus]